MSNKVSVRLAIIHNGDEARLRHLRPSCARLCEALLPRYEPSVLEVSWAPPMTSHGKAMALLKDLWFWALRRQWTAYCLKPPPAVLPSLHSYYRWKLRKYVGMARSRTELATWQRTSAVEALVADKHARAWLSFVDQSLDYLIVFEDDAVFRPDSIDRISALFAALETRGSKAGLYVNLAGGLALDRDLGIAHLITAETDGLVAFSRPTTNTGCAYLLDRVAARHFGHVLVRHPWIRLITPDWMMNKIFMCLAREGVLMDCWHARPPIFNHGSLTGEYGSSIR